MCYNCGSIKLANDGEIVKIESNDTHIFETQNVEQAYASFGVSKEEQKNKYSYLNMRRILYYYNHTKLNKELTSIFKDVEQW
jgi:alanine dehydrogenase